MPSDEKTVIIPAGSLGVSFMGKPATISRIQDDSPVKAQFRVGMVVDRLTLPNGPSYSGLSTTELVTVLKDSAILEGREVHLVSNTDTTDLSAKLHPSASLRPTTTPTTSTKTQRRNQRLASIPSQQQQQKAFIMVQDTVGSPKNEREKKLLQIRGELQGLIMKEDWSAIVGMIRGITLADRDLAVSLIQWKNKWQANEQTLLHDVLSMPSHDPPMSLVSMLVDTCPQVLFIEDGAGHLPLHVAIYTPDTPHQQKSMELIRLLVQADKRRRTLSPITFWQAIRRHDEQVIRYLLTFQECSKALVIQVNGRIPLYYVSKLQDDDISPLLQLMITSTVEAMNKSTCCFYRAIELVANYVHDSDALFEICTRQKLYCTNHLIDVARRRDVCVHKRQQRIKDASNNNKRESSQERESSTSTKPMKKVSSTEDAVSTEMAVNADANVGETNKVTVAEGTGGQEATKETESTEAAPTDEIEPDSSTEKEKVEGKEAGGAAKGSSEESKDGATASTAPVTP